MTTDEAAREDSVGGDADAEGARRWKNLSLDAAGDEGVLDLEIGHGMNGVRPAKRLGSGFREPEIADMPRANHLRNRARGLLDRKAGIHTARPVDVHVVGSQSA